MKKSNKNFSQASANSFDNLLAGFTEALEDNSNQIVKALKAIKRKKLTSKDKQALEKLGKEIKSLDKDLDSIGDFEDLGGLNGF